MPNAQTIAVLGAGSWGTTLAWLLGGKGFPVRLWGRDRRQIAEIAAARENARYAAGVGLPDSITPLGALEAALDGVHLTVVAVPARAVRQILTECRPLLPAGASALLAAKGLEQDTGKRLSEVAAEVLGPGWQGRIAVLSGPNLSGEVLRKSPTATVVSCPDERSARELQETLGTPFFRVYTNRDTAGVELGGALKNPVAIAAGISDGLGFGENTKAALLTRGLAEMTRLGVAAGARAETFSGLSGLGDLLATAHSPLSRNYRVGLALGRGETVERAAESVHQVAEGIPTTAAACILARSVGVEVPIMEELRAVLYEGKPVAEAVALLMARPYRDEGGSPP
jgi:glycerol-3-phosphate dehydrogenase (NAD(P)+)